MRKVPPGMKIILDVLLRSIGTLSEIPRSGRLLRFPWAPNCGDGTWLLALDQRLSTYFLSILTVNAIGLWSNRAGFGMNGWTLARAEIPGLFTQTQHRARRGVSRVGLPGISNSGLDPNSCRRTDSRASASRVRPPVLTVERYCRSLSRGARTKSRHAH